MDKNYFFRRQFLIGKNIENKLCWDYIDLKNEFKLFYNGDLEISIKENKDRKLILIGYALDPDNFKFNNSNILENLLNNNKFNDLFNKTCSFGGRWLIIYVSNDEFKILTDPTSLRRIYYTIDDEFLIGSDPNIINYFKEQKKSSDNQLYKYLNSSYYELEEKIWFSDRTKYNNIRKVLPNKYLDIDKRTTYRFWVDLPNDFTYEQNLKRIAHILINELKAISLRDRGIIQSISAGLDSRIMYAASKRANLSPIYFVSTKNILSDNDPDIYMPKKILKDYGDELIVLSNLEDFREDFLNIYNKNVDEARKLPKNLTIQALMDNYDNFYMITGNIAEVIENYYDRDVAYSGKEISEILGIPKYITFFNDSFDEWINETRSFLNDHNDIIPMKLFHWELDTGSWGTFYQAESDIAVDEFPPFNNREIFLRFWKCSNLKKYGKKEVYLDLLRILDKNLLNYPINPLTLKGKILKAIHLKLSYRRRMQLKILIRKLKQQ